MWGWGGGVSDCFAFKVVSFSSTKTPKLAVLLFRITKTNFFVSNSIGTIFGLSFGSIDMIELP
jgi:hypothetical protein